MFNEGAPEFILDQGLYYPIATNQGYYYTGFESPGEWDDHHRIFSLDGVDVQYQGVQTENMPYVYYTPSYEYAQSPYNPYNPYIPGAMLGVDDPYLGPQQFYTTMPPYQNPVSPYYPVLVQSRPDIFSNGQSDNLVDTAVSAGSRPSGQGLKHSLSSASAPFTMIPGKTISNSYTPDKAAEGPNASAGPSKQPDSYGRSAYGSIQGVDNVSKGRVQSLHNQHRPASTYSSGFSDSISDTHRQATEEKINPKFYYGQYMNDVSLSPDILVEQNRGPRINKPKNQLLVKADAPSFGHSNIQETVANTDQNSTDFPVNYVNAKFFVIKSYSEDDVHKSIKYNVWSSTPNGNKKLDHAYRDAQRIAAGKPRGCPVFMFFSVNASGQFCGLAEMIDPIDFKKDMDFWQQDKWSGSFPVKWHIIKDVPNTNFRHITLENNENKPVTNSRDTQEIMFKPGLEMLKIFKKYTLKTSLLDDFLYYENRQKIMQEGKARLLVKSYENPLFPTTLDPHRKLNSEVGLSTSEDVTATNVTDTNSNSHESSMQFIADQVSLKPDISDSSMNASMENNDVEAKDDITSTIKIGSLTINPKQHSEPKALPVSSVVVDSEPVEAVTVGSIPVNVNGLVGSSGFFTVGTIPLDPRATKLKK